MSKYKNTIPQDMKDVIKNYSTGLGIVGAGGGLVGPHADLAIILPSWVAMTVTLAKKAGHAMSHETAKKVAVAVCTGAGTFIGGTKAASTLFAWLTAPITGGLSLLAAAAANSALNASFTYAYGRSIAQFFLSTSEITDTEVAVKIIIALIGADLGIKTPHDHLLA